MDEIDRLTQELLQAIKNSSIYRVYREKEDQLSNDRELFERVNRFRGKNFYMQQNGDDLIRIAQQVAQESKELRRISKVNAYLDAELDFCRMMQKICATLTEGIDFAAPDL